MSLAPCRSSRSTLKKRKPISWKVQSALIRRPSTTQNLQITYSRITSPIDGRIGLRLVDVGNIVHATDQNGLFVITQLHPIAVIFTLPEDSLRSVSQRMKHGTLDVDAYARDNQTKLATGKLQTIDNQIDQQTGTGEAEGSFQKRGQRAVAKPVCQRAVAA